MLTIDQIQGIITEYRPSLLPLIHELCDTYRPEEESRYYHEVSEVLADALLNNAGIPNLHEEDEEAYRYLKHELWMSFIRMADAQRN